MPAPTPMPPTPKPPPTAFTSTRSRASRSTFRPAWTFAFLPTNALVPRGTVVVPNICVPLGAPVAPLTELVGVLLVNVVLAVFVVDPARPLDAETAPVLFEEPVLLFVDVVWSADEPEPPCVSVLTGAIVEELLLVSAFWLRVVPWSSNVYESTRLPPIAITDTAAPSPTAPPPTLTA